MRVREKYLPSGTRKELGLINYIKHRRETGICEDCGHTMKGHDTCVGCGILCGPGHDRSAEDYQGHNLCWSCIEGWKKKVERGEVFDLFKFCWPTGKPIGRPSKVHGEFALSIKEEKK